MGIRKSLAVFIAVIVLVGALVVPAAMAADKGATIGMVDVEKILKGYEKKKKSDEDVKALIDSLQNKFDLRNRNKLLTEAEMNELEGLRFKDKPTEKDKARITELEDLEKSRDSQLKDLQAKKDSTDADKAKLAELQAQGKKSEEALAKLAKDYATQIENKRVELGNTITKEVLDVIKVVAEEKSIGTVVDKVAVLYGGTDITDPVLERLNKKK